MNPLFQAGLELQVFFEAKGWPFCFIGGLAVIRWGEMRMTGRYRAVFWRGTTKVGKVEPRRAHRMEPGYRSFRAPSQGFHSPPPLPQAMCFWQDLTLPVLVEA